MFILVMGEQTRGKQRKRISERASLMQLADIHPQTIQMLAKIKMVQCERPSLARRPTGSRGRDHRLRQLATSRIYLLGKRQYMESDNVFRCRYAKRALASCVIHESHYSRGVQVTHLQLAARIARCACRIETFPPTTSFTQWISTSHNFGRLSYNIRKSFVACSRLWGDAMAGLWNEPAPQIRIT
jgi:hypothetical protein